jgi:microcompartment protein CcmL/EutN
MRKIFLVFILILISSCGPTMIQASNYDDFRNQTLKRGWNFTAEAYSNSLPMIRGGMGAGNTQLLANKTALDMCAKVASDCIITKENDNVVRITLIQSQKELNETKSQEIQKIKATREEEELKKQKIAKQEEIKKQKEIKFSELEKLYSGKCNFGFTKGTEKYNNCLLEQETKTLAFKNQQSEKLAIAEEKKQKIIKEKQALAETKAKEEAIKLAKMKPEDRNAYTCTEKFGFRKGSDKFKDCIFELYKAEAELEKLELQKQVAKANAEAARANAEAARAGAERQERLALAQTEAAKMQALAARQQAIAANTADSLALIESGLRMMSPQRPAPRMQTSCTYVGRFLNCF